MKNPFDIFKRRKRGKDIFAHKANGESCPICGLPMYTKQRIMATVADGKMHASCFPESFKRALYQIAEQAQGR